MAEAKVQRSYEELLAICARLEAESGHHLVVQRDLIGTKDRLDRELMRFKAIQNYITNALEASTVGEFHTLTLESIIEAFEFEVALVLRTTGDGNTLVAAGEFGFDDPPGLCRSPSIGSSPKTPLSSMPPTRFCKTGRNWRWRKRSSAR